MKNEPGAYASGPSKLLANGQTFICCRNCILQSVIMDASGTPFPGPETFAAIETHIRITPRTMGTGSGMKICPSGLVVMILAL